MLTKNEILAFLKENKTYFLEHFHLIKIGLFGSFATDTATDDSDVDLIVEFEPGTPDLYKLKNEMREYFKIHFKKDIDLAREKYLKTFVKHHILKQTIYV